MGKSRVFWGGALVIISTLLIAPSHHITNQLPVRILPLGDSITQGGITDREEYTYRFPLQQLLLDAEVQFDFIGSVHTGLQPEAKWPDVAPGVPFDPDHEGHYGWKTAEVRDRLKESLQLYEPPDIVLVHLGTNDQNAAKGAKNEVEEKRLLTQAIVQPLEDIIQMLRVRNSKVVILVGHLMFDSEQARQIRLLVEAMANRLSTPDSPVVTVHHYRGFIVKPGPGSDTFDWAHPNPQGQAKMAIAWFEIMKPYLHSKNPK